MMDNSSDKASEKQGVQNKNGKVTPVPPTEGKKTSQSVKSVSNTEAIESQGTVEKKNNQSQRNEKEKEKQITKAASKTSVSSKDTVPPRDQDVKEHQPGKEEQKRYRALLLSWEVSWNAVGIAACLANGNKVSDFSYVALSPPTKDSEWTPPVDQSSIVIIYSSPKSERPLYQMERYLDYCSSKKGTQKVIVVIGEEDDIQKWKDKWEENQFSKTLDKFRFSRAELDCITRKDIVEEMLEKIDKLRKSLISPTGLQEKPSGNKEVKQVPQITEKIKRGKQDKMNKQQSNKHNKDNMTKNQQLQKGPPSNNTTQVERHGEMNQAIRILSWPKTDSHWLLTLLRSPYFRETVKDVETINVTGSELEKITEQTSSVTTYIFYFTKESLKLFNSQLHNSVKLLSNFENKKIIVVIDNLENKYDEQEATKLYHKLPISSLSKHLFLFWKREKETDYLTHLTKNQQVAEKAEQKMKQFQNLINERIGGPDTPWPGPRTVGIFSRSAKEDYEWLAKLLKSPKCQDFVKDVRPFYISNKGYEDFYKEVINCTFGILYHTKNRGRVNITDVTDSLYDMEIEYMSSALGRCNILVVIDDLKDSGPKEKERILYTQPSIRKYARNLLLVTPEEKKDKEILLSKLMEIFVSPAIKEAETPQEAEASVREMDTKNSAGEKDTKNPAREKDTKNPAGEKDTKNPAREKDTKNPAGEKNTKNSAREKNTKNPAREKDTKNPAGEKDTKNPAGKKDTKNPAGEKDTKNPAGEKDTKNPAGEKDTMNPAGQKDTKNPAGEKDTKNPAGEKDTKNPAGEKNTENPAGEKDTMNPAVQKDTKNPAGERDTKNPAGEKDTKNPAGENTKNSAREKDTKNPAGEKDTKNPAGEKDTMNPVGQKDTKNPAGEKDTKNPAGEKDTKNPAGEKDTKNPAGEKNTKNPAGEKDTKNPAGEKDTMSPAGQKDTKNPAGEKDTKNPAGEKDTKNPAGEKNTNNSAGEKDKNNSAGEKDTKNSAGEKNTKNSTGEKDTKSSAGEDTRNSAGVDTNNSAGEKDKKNSAGEEDTQNSAREKDTNNYVGNTNKVDAGNDAEKLNKGDEGKTNKQTEPNTAK